MDMNPGTKAWFVDLWDYNTIKQCTLVEKYYLDGGTKPWWKVKLSHHALRHKAEHQLYPTKKVAKAAFRMGL